jgi:hydrogenase maturation protease
VVVELGTAVLDALNLLASARTVVALDAVQAGGPPGTIYEMPLAAVRKRGPSTSLHEFDLYAACRLLPADCRPDVVVVGVEPQSIECGLELSPSVQAVLPEFIGAARRVAVAQGKSRRRRAAL